MLNREEQQATIGIRPGELWVIGAMSGRGKTTAPQVSHPDIAHQFLEAGHLARRSAALIERSISSLPHCHRVRLQRLLEVQRALAACFSRLGEAYTGKEAA